MTQAIVREPGKAPQPLCDAFYHYGIFHNSSTDEIQCAGCGRLWIPSIWIGIPDPVAGLPTTDPAWTSAWLDKPRPITPPSQP